MLRDTLALRDFLGDMRMMVTNWDSHTLKIPLPEEHHLPVNADGDKETLKKEITSAVDSACFTLSGMDAEGKEEYLKSRGEEGLESFEGLRNLFPVFGEESAHEDDDEERGSSLGRSERSPLLSSSVKSYTGSDRLYTRSLM